MKTFKEFITELSTDALKSYISKRGEQSTQLNKNLIMQILKNLKKLQKMLFLSISKKLVNIVTKLKKLLILGRIHLATEKPMKQ